MRRLPHTVWMMAWAAGAASAGLPARAERAVTPPPLASSSGRRADVEPAHRVLPFLHGDYTRAVAEARARRVPLFIEAWAPW